MKSGFVLIFMSLLSFFIIACSSPPATPPTFIHVVPTYQEVVAFDTSLVPPLQIATIATSRPLITDLGHQAADRRPLSDAGLPCAETYDCKGFCLALERNTTLGYCSDTHTPRGCWEYLLGKNVTKTICS